MAYIVYNNTFTTKFIHRKSKVAVLYSSKFIFQIVIFYLSDSRLLADLVFKLVHNYLGYRPTAFKNRYSSMMNSSMLLSSVKFKESMHTIFNVSY